MLYPGLSAVKLVGTDLVQAVPLVLAAAISNIALNGLDWSILIPLVLGSMPGTILGAGSRPRSRSRSSAAASSIVLTMSGVALLDKAGWAPLGAGEDDTHPVLIAVDRPGDDRRGPADLGAVLRKEQGLPFMGAPTVAELEGDRYSRRRT